MNTCQVGNITEVRVLVRLIEADCYIYLPYGEGHKSDLIFDNGEKLNKVQIKPSSKNVLGFSIRLYRSSGGKYKKLYKENEVDYFGTFFEGKVYLIPFTKVKGKYEATLRVGKIKNYSHCKLAADEFEI